MTGEYSIVNDHHIVNIHHMTHKHMGFGQSVLRMNIVDANSIVKTSNYQFTTDNVSTVDGHLVASYFILVPK